MLLALSILYRRGGEGFNTMFDLHKVKSWLLCRDVIGLHWTDVNATLIRFKIRMNVWAVFYLTDIFYSIWNFSNWNKVLYLLFFVNLSKITCKIISHFSRRKKFQVYTWYLISYNLHGFHACLFGLQSIELPN